MFAFFYLFLWLIALTITVAKFVMTLLILGLAFYSLQRLWRIGHLRIPFRGERLRLIGFVSGNLLLVCVFAVGGYFALDLSPGEFGASINSLVPSAFGGDNE